MKHETMQYKTVRYMLAFFMVSVWVLLTVKMIKTENTELRSFLQLAVIGLAIGMFASVSSAYAAEQDSKSESDDIAYAI